MVVSAVFVLDLKGRVIIYRDYRGDVKPNLAEKFVSKLNELEEVGKLTPVLCDEGVSYVWVQHSNLYLLGVTRSNANATAVVLFLHRLVEVFKQYFQELEEESLKDNFVIVYELLDEVMDFGYPQFTEAKILAEYIKTDAHKMELQVSWAVGGSRGDSRRMGGSILFDRIQMGMEVAAGNVVDCV